MTRTVLVGAAMFVLGFMGATLVAKDPNAKARWVGSTPANCQALIAENIRGWKLGNHTAESAIDSIDRWCGLYGSLWGK
jgi:hypothetical protein